MLSSIVLFLLVSVGIGTAQKLSRKLPVHLFLRKPQVGDVPIVEVE